MNVLTVYAHRNPKSLRHALLRKFSEGLADPGHSNDIVDLYAIRIDPVFRMVDFASYVLGGAGGPMRRFFAKGWVHFPAILKGWCERVFATGDAYALGKQYAVA